MKLINGSKEFVLWFNGSDYVIPEGEFEVVNERLGNHILFIANKWQKDVSIVPNSSINEIVPTAKKKEVKSKKQTQTQDVDDVEKKESKINDVMSDVFDSKKDA